MNTVWLAGIRDVGRIVMGPISLPVCHSNLKKGVKRYGKHYRERDPGHA